MVHGNLQGKEVQENAAWKHAACEWRDSVNRSGPRCRIRSGLSVKDLNGRCHCEFPLKALSAESSGGRQARQGVGPRGFPAPRPLIAGLAALWLAACTTMSPSPPPAALPDPAQTLVVPSGYTLVWSDEFGSDGLPDPSRWAYDTGMNKTGWHNRELQYYSAARARERRAARWPSDHPGTPGDDVAGIRLGRSALHLVASVDQGLAEWTYGFFEIRARLPCGKGSWPAIWMLNSALDWPKGGELDIMEHVGREPGRIFSTVHTAAAHGAGKGGATLVPDACVAFHDYQMHWTPQMLRFGIDGKVHFVYPNPGTGPEQVALRHAAVPDPQHRRRRRPWRGGRRHPLPVAHGDRPRSRVPAGEVAAAAGTVPTQGARRL